MEVSKDGKNSRLQGISLSSTGDTDKKALDGMKEGKLVTIVDNQVAKENVRKMAEKLNIGVEIEEKEDLYHITLTKGGLKKQKGWMFHLSVKG